MFLVMKYISQFYLMVRHVVRKIQEPPHSSWIQVGENAVIHPDFELSFCELEFTTEFHGVILIRLNRKALIQSYDALSCIFPLFPCILVSVPIPSFKAKCLSFFLKTPKFMVCSIISRSINSNSNPPVWYGISSQGQRCARCTGTTAHCKGRCKGPWKLGCHQKEGTCGYWHPLSSIDLL